MTAMQPTSMFRQLRLRETGCLARARSGMPTSFLTSIEPHNPWRTQAGGVFNLQYSPQGSVLVAACEDATVRVYDPLNPRIQHRLSGHTDCVNVVSFLDDVTFVTGGDDATLRVWDARRMQLVSTLYGHRAWVKNIDRIDATTFVSCAWDGGVRVWSRDQLYPEPAAYSSHASASESDASAVASPEDVNTRDGASLLLDDHDDDGPDGIAMTNAQAADLALAVYSATRRPAATPDLDYQLDQQTMMLFPPSSASVNRHSDDGDAFDADDDADDDDNDDHHDDHDHEGDGDDVFCDHQHCESQGVVSVGGSVGCVYSHGARVQARRQCHRRHHSPFRSLRESEGQQHTANPEHIGTDVLGVLTPAMPIPTRSSSTTTRSAHGDGDGDDVAPVRSPTLPVPPDVDMPPLSLDCDLPATTTMLQRGHYGSGAIAHPPASSSMAVLTFDSAMSSTSPTPTPSLVHSPVSRPMDMASSPLMSNWCTPPLHTRSPLVRGRRYSGFAQSPAATPIGSTGHHHRVLTTRLEQDNPFLSSPDPAPNRRGTGVNRTSVSSTHGCSNLTAAGANVLLTEGRIARMRYVAQRNMMLMSLHSGSLVLIHDVDLASMQSDLAGLTLSGLAETWQTTSDALAAQEGPQPFLLPSQCFARRNRVEAVPFADHGHASSLQLSHDGRFCLSRRVCSSEEERLSVFDLTTPTPTIDQLRDAFPNARASHAAFLRPSIYTPIFPSRTRLDIADSASGANFIKGPCFSGDSRFLFSPYENGVRIFDWARVRDGDLPDSMSAPQRPRRVASGLSATAATAAAGSSSHTSSSSSSPLRTAAMSDVPGGAGHDDDGGAGDSDDRNRFILKCMDNCHNSTVLTTRCHPHMPMLASGAADGTINYYQPHL